MAVVQNRIWFLITLGAALLAATTGLAQSPGATARDADAKLTGDSTAAADKAQPPAGSATDTAPATDVSLSAEQAKLAGKYKELERVILRMAEVMQTTDPKRAALLRQAFAKSKERQIELQYEDLVKLLQQEQLYQASKGQVAVQQDLNQLLQLLMSGEREKQIPSQRAEIKRFIERINKLIREEQGLQGETEGQGDTPDLIKQQDSVAKKTGELAKDLNKFDAENNPTAGGADAKESDKPDDKDQGKSSDKKSDGKQADDKKAEDKKADGKGAEKSDKNADSKEGSDQADGKNDNKSNGEPSDKSGGKPDQKTDKKSGQQKSEDKKSADQRKDKEADDKKSEQQKSSEKSDDKSEQGSQSKSQSQPSKGQPQKGKSQDGQPKDNDDDNAEQQKSPSGNQPAGKEESPARKRIRQAEDRMRTAKRQLEQAQRRGAADEQQRAVEELKLAKAELEEILRQLREEEIERVLAQLEGRFRKMLQMQVEVYEGTIGLDRIPEDERDRDAEIESGKLSRRESEIATEADKTLALLHEEGSSVAFPESLDQVREDMAQTASRLGRANVGQITQGIEQDIVKALEEMVAALQKAQKDQRQRSSGGGGGGGGGKDQPLLDSIAELKMIRALQMRVNTRTERYSKLIADGSEQAESPDLVEAVQRLSQREERIYRTTRDIVVGKNK